MKIPHPTSHFQPTPQKKETTLKTVKRFYSLTKPYLKWIILIIILAIIDNVLSASRPLIIKTIIDQFMQNKIFEKSIEVLGKSFVTNVLYIGLLYIIIVLFENIIDFIVVKLTANVGENILSDIREKIFNFSQKTNISFHDKTPAGKLYVRITSDTEDIGVFFQEVLINLFRDITYVIVVFIIMIRVNWKLTIVAVSILIICLLGVSFFIKKANKFYKKAKTIRTKLNTFLSEVIYGSRTIKIFNIQSIIKERETDLTDKFEKAGCKAALMDAPIFPMISFCLNLVLALIIAVGVKKLWGVDINAGEIYIFITFVKEVFEPIAKTMENVEGVQEAVVSLNKIYDLIEQEGYLEDYNSGMELKDVKGKLEFKHVWFKYNDTDENWILKDISFTIEPTETIALVGKTGAGKTTITNLVNRFYEIQKGEILIDGINIKDISLNSLRGHIGNILQEPFIFSGSVKDNIKLYKDINDEQVEKAVDLALARNFVDSLPNGIETEAIERGENFSVGQKQLIAFARIFALNPDIFILDEATANIDTNTEKLIQKSIEKLSKEKTAIFIAHRLSTIVNVDKILVLKDGEIIEQGKHDELLKQKGYYANLYNSYYESCK